MTNLEMAEKAAREIFNAKTPEEVEYYVRLIAWMFKG
jgi:hypothetical protein